jgi:hypothetical protein
MTNIYAIVNNNNNTIIATGRAKALWPQMSFADSGPREDWLIEQGAQPIRYDPPYDPGTHQLQPSAPYLLDGVVYAREAVSKPEPEPPGPDYAGFYDDLIASSVYQSISFKAALFQPLLAASTEFIAAFGDAKADRPNPDAIQMTVWKLMYWLNPGETEITAIQAMLAANHLDALYSLEVPAPVLAAFNAQPNPFSFYAGVLGSNFYQQKLVPIILSGASSVPGDATTIMGFAIKDAQSGLVPPPAPGGPPNSLQSALWLFMAAVGPQLDEADVAEIQGLLDAANLSSMYTLIPPEHP